jgi:hypothetical protein
VCDGNHVDNDDENEASVADSVNNDDDNVDNDDDNGSVEVGN